MRNTSLDQEDAGRTDRPPFGLGDGRLIALLAVWPILSLLAAAAFGFAAGALAAVAAVALAIAAAPRQVYSMLVAGRVEVMGSPVKRLAPMAAQLPHAGYLLLRIEGLTDLAEEYGELGRDRALARLEDRLGSILRREDGLRRVGRGLFAVTTRSASPPELETMMQIASRLQLALAEPFDLEGNSLRRAISIGFSFSAEVRPPEDRLRREAETALREARHAGPGTIRAFSAELDREAQRRDTLAAELAEALHSGKIEPWFQPQVSTDTGKVSGFEALARWIHPEHGAISPGEFLPLIEAAGRSSELTQRILDGALEAVAGWDEAGLDVPTVSVNLGAADLDNPGLADHIAWALDRHDLAPHRLTLEILETVVAQSVDGPAAQNIARLSALGCRIDLDDFGIGHASITTIRRFAIDRLKIDRSFVTDIDTDREQQRMVATILTMSDQLGLDTLAEGVETPAEHTMLAQLGCRHVQGFGIARPMPREDTAAWCQRHHAQLALAMPPQRGSG